MKKFFACFCLFLSVGVCQAVDEFTIPLLKTQWAQRGLYAKYTPNQQRLGCWSVAFAQILYHHRIQPSGTVEYEGEGYKISETMDHTFNWKLFTKQLKKETPKVQQNEVSRYCYYTALACKKDFAEDQAYIGNSDVRRQGITKHFGCETRRYRIPQEGEDVVNKVIFSELAAGRPLLLYACGKDGLGHAFVIDGAKVIKDHLVVHLNCGWEGADDDWYIFNKPFKTSHGLFDHPSRWVLTVQPKET